VTVRSQQSGYALLLMLFVLLGAGVAGFSRLAGHHGATAQGFTTAQYAMQTARQAMLSYTALYPYLYGPRGAGPGHLPCPDTDVSTIAHASQASNRDGPNPPCGSEAVATGLLPRQVNLPGYRYVFHVEPFQRFEYLVSSDMINNPVNRMVNDDVIRGVQGELPFLAWIRQPLVDQGQSTALISQVPITRRSLLPGVRQSVAAWLVQRINRQTSRGCSPVPGKNVELSWAEGMGLQRLIADSQPEPLTPVSTEPDHAPDTCLEMRRSTVASTDQLLEGVPLASHWFVRNGWHERIILQASEACTSDQSRHCLLVPDRHRLHRNDHDERLYFTWQVVS
jgi:hypothetical protein